MGGTPWQPLASARVLTCSMLAAAGSTTVAPDPVRVDGRPETDQDYTGASRWRWLLRVPAAHWSRLSERALRISGGYSSAVGPRR
jgi:hypothetical protein